MKKHFLFLATGLLMSFQIYAQAKITTTGNNLVTPGDPRSADIVIGSDAGTRHDGSIMWWSNGSASRISNTGDVFNLSVWNTAVPNIGLSATVGGASYFQGSLGIGTTYPQANLEVKSTSDYDSHTMLRITNNSTDFGRTNLVLTGRIQGGNDSWNFGTSARNSIVFAQNAATPGANIGSTGEEKYSLQLEGNSNSLGFLSRQNGGAPNMVLTQSGLVGIGTTSPDPNYRLSVNGSIRSKEVRVEAGWSDYVFQKDYDLMPLHEVEMYIRKQGHLPDVPSAAVVKSSGINVGETESLLLKKIEELTLYLLEKDKQVQSQQVQIKKLNAQMASVLKNFDVKPRSKR
jgi:hypothetical protein